MIFRIGESSPSHQASQTDAAEEKDAEAGAHSSAEQHGHMCAAAGRATGENQSTAGTAEKPARVGSGLRRGGENNPDRYLHRILH